MIKIELTDNIDLIKEVVQNPIVFAKLFGNPTLNPKDWEPEPGFQYLKIMYNDKLMGLFPYKVKSELLLEVHIFILPKYCTKHYVHKAISKAVKWVKTNISGVKTLMTWCPDNCLHIINFLTTLGFKPRGHIPNAVIYNQQIAGMLIWDIDLDSFNLMRSE